MGDGRGKHDPRFNSLVPSVCLARAGSGRQLSTPQGQAALAQPELALDKSTCWDQALLPTAWLTQHEERRSNTESQIGSGWKGPQLVIWSILLAQAGFP